MLNKRKALIGYGVYTLGKPLAKRKLRKQQADAAAKRKKVLGGVAAATAAAGATIGGLMFWRKWRSGGTESTGS